MRMSAQAAVAGVMPSCADETRVFFDILTHDDHNSNYLLVRNDRDRWTTRPVRAGQYDRLAFSDHAAYYLTRNGFTGAKRLTERCRQVNALMFDIDCHGKGATSALPDLTALLYDSFNNGALPQPSLFVFSGRGLHLYYVLDKATPYRVKGGALNDRGLKFVHDVEAGLCRKLTRVVSSIPQAEVDTSVFDFTRIARVPGSWNTKAGCDCTLLSYSTDFFTLAGLKAFGEFPDKGQNSRSSAASAVKSAFKPRRSRMVKFDKMLTARLRKIEELQAYRNFDCHGSRENMCFVHYNTATQIYGPDEAFRLTSAFNARFHETLPAQDIASIKKTVDSVVVAFGPCKGQSGFYPLSASNLSSKLHMSPEEAAKVSFFSPNKQRKRAEIKAATQKRKLNRNDEIVRLYSQEGLTQREIVSRLAGSKNACCLRTVASVIAARGAVRARKIALRKAAQAALKAQLRPAFASHGLASSREDAKTWPTSCCVAPLPFASAFRSGFVSSFDASLAFSTVCSSNFKSRPPEDLSFSPGAYSLST